MAARIFSLDEISALVHQVSTIIHCATSMNTILKSYFGETEEYIMQEDWEDYGSGFTYNEYVLNRIDSELAKHGIVGVDINNGTGEYGSHTFDHLFILVNGPNGVYRIESYVYLYCTRAVPFPNYRETLRTLLNLPPGPNRVAYWNGLFNANETTDTQNSFDVVLNGPVR